ncbi:transcription factor E2F3-like isoform X1 [Amblyomma americanum]
MMISTRQVDFIHPEMASGSFKTPTAKESDGSRRSLIKPGQLPAAAIVMDEYGQTPDHFYLARNPAKPPAERNQVKRRLDMESPEPFAFKAPAAAKKGRLASSAGSSHQKSRSERNRYDTSLGLLTKKFVQLLKGASDGVVDLNRASEQLGVQKRRIYDITNVLEGVGLIEKKSKNNIRWREGSRGAASLHGRQQALQQEIEECITMERELDQLLAGAVLDLQGLTEHTDRRHAYVTYRDLRSISSLADQTVIAVKAPPETRLEVPDPRKGLQIWLKSDKGEIEVYLSNPEDPAGLGSSSSSSKAESPAPVLLSSGDLEEEEMLAQSATGGPSVEELCLKRALISEEDDLAPMGGRQLLLQTEDQLLADGFVQLEPPLSEEDYAFTLDQAEGITELFDDYDFSDLCPPK